MWIATTDGYFSINRRGENINIRARSRKDLENLKKRIGSNATILMLGRSDYEYRIEVKPRVLLEYLEDYVLESLSYANFKDEVKKTNPARAQTYTRFWYAGLEIEEEEHAHRPKQGRFQSFSPAAHRPAGSPTLPKSYPSQTLFQNPPRLVGDTLVPAASQYKTEKELEEEIDKELELAWDQEEASLQQATPSKKKRKRRRRNRR